MKCRKCCNQMPVKDLLEQFGSLPAQMILFQLMYQFHNDPGISLHYGLHSHNFHHQNHHCKVYALFLFCPPPLVLSQLFASFVSSRPVTNHQNIFTITIPFQFHFQNVVLHNKKGTELLVAFHCKQAYTPYENNNTSVILSFSNNY